MAGLKGIKKNSIETITKNLPSPIKQHMKRCRDFGEFLLHRMLNDDDFINIVFNKRNMLNAIYYHDIGKSEILKDYIQFKYCKTKESQNIYFTHVEKGIEIIKRLLPNDILKYSKDSFETYLYQCISQHHEAMNGKGYPGRFNETQISLAGRVCSIIDKFDNFVFVGNTGEIKFKEGLEKFKKEIGITLDPKISNLFIKDEEVLEEYVNRIAVTEKNRIRSNPYGIIMLYEPIYNLYNKEEINFESRMRINDPYFGLMKPGLFIPISEKSNQIYELFYLTLGKVCQTIIKLENRNVNFNRITLHMNARQLYRDNFIKAVSDVINKYQVSPQKITFEITQRDELEKTEAINNTLMELREMGFKIILDEFGEQFASFDLLSDLPFDGVKISERYTKDLDRNTKNIEIVKGMIQTVRNLKLEVICQGIDNDEQENLVKSFGCNYVQGEKYSLPMRDSKLVNYLDESDKTEEEL